MTDPEKIITIRIDITQFLRELQVATVADLLMLAFMLFLVVFLIVGIGWDAMDAKQRYKVLRWFRSHFTLLEHWQWFIEQVDSFADVVRSLSICNGREISYPLHRWEPITDDLFHLHCANCEKVISYLEGPWKPNHSLTGDGHNV